MLKCNSWTKFNGEKTLMRHEKLTAGLYIVATPIGAARDITLKALDILNSADILVAEDTRNLRKLMDIHGVDLNTRPMWAYHDHNGDQQRPKILTAIENGASVAFVSDAGTPLIADPGYSVSRDAVIQGLKVTTAPGASAVMAALCMAGMPTDRFMFAGFVPNKVKARGDFLTELAPINATLVVYDSPKRVLATLSQMADVFGATREIALCRELTKKFEEVVRGSIETVHDMIDARESLKGEIVLVLGPPKVKDVTDADITALLNVSLTTSRLKEASTQIAQDLGVSKKRVYALGLALKD